MKLNSKLSFYAFLDKFKLVKNSYTAKILLVAFLGTHVPLLTLMVSFLLSNSYTLEAALQVLFIALLATLIGTAVTLYAINRLLLPIVLTSKALRNYIEKKALPKLPTQFGDEVGTLMADTSQTLHQLDELIHYICNYNEITGLPNEELLHNRLQPFSHSSQQDSRLIAFVIIQINNFAEISSVLDQEAKILLLRGAAQRLNACLASGDILAHLKDDEFAIARIEIPSFESLIQLSQSLIQNLSKPFSIKGQTVYLTASVGITVNSITPTNGVDILLRQAKMALHQAQQEGRSQYRFYSPEFNTQLQERLTLENELHGALERKEILVHYQPLIDLHSNSVIAVEALVRWQHPTLGLISPVKFIPIAEANNLIVPIGEWVLRTACEQNRRWQLAGLPPIRVSVNLSARQFELPNLVEIVNQILQETQLNPSYLELEVTESFLMADIQRSVETLQGLQQLGIVIALDDFGTGYSSLNYLNRFPVNMLKIDRSFVQDMIANPDSAAVTDAIIALAKSLRLSITAEGVETQEQLEYLQKQGCDEGQGYYFSRPIPSEAMTEILQKSPQESLISVR